MTIFFLLCVILFSGYSETIYVYTYELCNNEPVPIDIQAKEGILDGLFDAGHIVFDDIHDSQHENLLAKGKIATLINHAKKGGAYYLVCALIITTVKPNPTENEYIESHALYYLYDVLTGNLLKEGNTTVNNRENKTIMNKKNLWFQLGLYISKEISQF